MSSLDSILDAVKDLTPAELMKIVRLVASEMDKKWKTVGSKPKKDGSMPKGEVPPQLRRPRAWVEFVFQHATTHGWKSFTVSQTKKNKETGEKVTEEVEMPASILYEGSYIYAGSITEKTPQGKKMIHKDAMSLSKSYWTAKTEEGTHKELYEEFLASYKEEEVIHIEEEDGNGLMLRLSGQEAEELKEEPVKEEKKKGKKAPSDVAPSAPAASVSAASAAASAVEAPSTKTPEKKPAKSTPSAPLKGKKNQE